jgi:hypothetical protein
MPKPKADERSPLEKMTDLTKRLLAVPKADVDKEIARQHKVRVDRRRRRRRRLKRKTA